MNNLDWIKALPSVETPINKNFFYELQTNILNLAFPIGKIEIFYDNEDHSNFMGFAWEKFGEGRALVGIDINNANFNTIGKKVGNESNSYNLAHTHTQNATGATALGISNLPSRTVVNTKVNMTKNYLDTVSGSITNYNIHCLADSGETSGVAHTHTNPSTNSALGNKSISTIQPSIVVAFWKRIA